MKTTFTPRNFLFATLFIFVSIPLVYGATLSPTQPISEVSPLHYVNEKTLPSAAVIRTSYDLMRPTFDKLAQCDRYQENDGSAQDLDVALKNAEFRFGGFSDTCAYMQDIWIHAAGWVIRVKSKGTKNDSPEFTIGYNDQNLWNLKDKVAQGKYTYPDFLRVLKNPDGEILKVTFGKDYVGPLAPAFGKEKARVQWCNVIGTKEVLDSAHQTLKMTPYFFRKHQYVTHYDYSVDVLSAQMRNLGN